MFKNIARQVAPKPSAIAPESMNRRGFVRGSLATLATGIVGASSAKVVLAAESALDPCQICVQQNPGCSAGSVYYDCNPDGSGIKCCSCNSGAFPCSVVCVDWPAGCYSPAP